MSDNITIPERTAMSHLLYQRLRDSTEEETVSYEELSQIAGEDVQKKRRDLLYTAMGMALRTNKFLFEAVKSQGIRRIKNDVITPVVMARTISRIQSTTRIGRKKLGCVNYQALTMARQAEHDSGLSAMAAMEMVTRQVVTQLPANVPMQNTLTMEGGLVRIKTG
jgi:hypothetical protein